MTMVWLAEQAVIFVFIRSSFIRMIYGEVSIASFWETMA